jgi:hypothetical protein
MYRVLVNVLCLVQRGCIKPHMFTELCGRNVSHELQIFFFIWGIKDVYESSTHTQNNTNTE